MSRRPARILALTAALTLALSACGADSQAPADSPTATTTVQEPGPSTPAATETPSEPTHTPPAEPEEPTGASPDDEAGAGEVSGVPVYYVVETPDGPRLVREFRTVPDEGDLVTSAVMAMMSVAPKDPDYWSSWRAPASLEVTRAGDRVTVDVPSTVFAGGAGASYEVAGYQQLVHTVTAAAAVDGNPVTEVVLLQDGARGDGWGHVGVGDVWTRAPQAEILSFVWVLSPAEGETVPAGEVTINGYGASFEGNFIVRVTGNGVDVMEPTTGTGMGFGEFSYSLELAPGQYTVSVENTSGKDDFEPTVDTKTFTVR